VALTIESPADVDEYTEFLEFFDDVYAERRARWPSFVSFQLPLLTGESPFAERRRVRPFLARRDGRVVARVLAVIDEAYQERWGEPLGHLNMFEALPDAAAATRPLLAAASTWLAEEGARAARVGFAMLESPFATDAYDVLPPSWLRQNPPYYHALFEDAGFTPERRFVDYKIEVRPELIARWQDAVDAAARADFELIRLRDVPPARGVAEFTRVWNEAFARHWGQTPFSDAEVQALVEVLAPAGMLDVSRLAYDRGVAVGVVWIVPTTASLALTAPGRDVAPAERLNNLGIGVLAPVRGRGLNLALAGRAFLDLAAQGATHVSYTLVLDDNWPSRRTAEKLGAAVCAHYVAYCRPLA
jgi:RimJ/RimL family protein N-acetyltransferase